MSGRMMVRLCASDGRPKSSSSSSGAPAAGCRGALLLLSSREFRLLLDNLLLDSVDLLARLHDLDAGAPEGHVVVALLGVALVLLRDDGAERRAQDVLVVLRVLLQLPVTALGALLETPEVGEVPLRELHLLAQTLLDRRLLRLDEVLDEAKELLVVLIEVKQQVLNANAQREGHALGVSGEAVALDDLEAHARAQLAERAVLDELVKRLVELLQEVGLDLRMRAVGAGREEVRNTLVAAVDESVQVEPSSQRLLVEYLLARCQRLRPGVKLHLAPSSNENA
jgi:hypothetical protein